MRARNHRPRIVLQITLVALAMIGWIDRPLQAANQMIQVEVRGQRVEGKTLSFSSSGVEMMLRDGKYIRFKPSEGRNFRKTGANFRSYSAGEIRSRLAAELGPRFAITGTGHYLVAHPRGQKDLWAQRFEDLYRDFVHYFSVRGFRLNKPEFPLIAVVWKNKNEFQRNAARSGLDVSSSVLGYYYPVTNRVHLYDVTNGSKSRNGWQQNARTIIHEVTHQTAFNTGVHTRFADTPNWVVEGLGTLFESRGIYNSRQYSRRADRINRDQLAAFKAQAKKRKNGFLVEMLSSDRLFERNPGQAYAQAWALTYYLVETQSRRYASYLERVARHETGKVYSQAARLADFSSIFGDNMRMHEARFKRFMAGVR